MTIPSPISHEANQSHRVRRPVGYLAGSPQDDRHDEGHDADRHDDRQMTGTTMMAIGSMLVGTTMIGTTTTIGTTGIRTTTIGTTSVGANTTETVTIAATTIKTTWTTVVMVISGSKARTTASGSLFLVAGQEFVKWERFTC